MTLLGIRSEQSLLLFKKALVVSAARAFTVSIERDYCISNKYLRQSNNACSGIFFSDTIKA